MGYITHIVYSDSWLTPQIKKAVNANEMSLCCSFEKCVLFKEDNKLIKKPKPDEKMLKIVIYTKIFPKQFLSELTASFGKYAHIYCYRLPKMVYEGGLAKCMTI